MQFGYRITLTCHRNNISLQYPQQTECSTTGNNALAQSGGNGLLSGNSAAQGIGQSQESDQSSLVASGDNTDLSGNNINLQDQTNTWKQRLRPKVVEMEGYSGNSDRQAIGQSQSSNQNA